MSHTKLNSYERNIAYYNTYVKKVSIVESFVGIFRPTVGIRFDDLTGQKAYNHALKLIYVDKTIG